MTTLLKPEANIIYPSEDNTPLAETSIHLDVIINTVVILRHYLKAQNLPGIILSNQFVYYAQGFPKLRVAPDIAVVFDLPTTKPDSYKIWESGQVPSVIFEITSKSTQSQDQGFKKDLYESLGVEEYWLFDPRAEWLNPPLQGYRLVNDFYTPILNTTSASLGLRLELNGYELDFFRLDNEEKLLAPDRLNEALQQAEVENSMLIAQLRRLGIEPDI